MYNESILVSNLRKVRGIVPTYARSSEIFIYFALPYAAAFGQLFKLSVTRLLDLVEILALEWNAGYFVVSSTWPQIKAPQRSHILFIMEITATTRAKFVSTLTCLRWPMTLKPETFLLEFVYPQKHIDSNPGFGFTACNCHILKSYLHIFVTL